MAETNAIGRVASVAQYMSFGWVAIPLPLVLILKKNLTLNRKHRKTRSGSVRDLQKLRCVQDN